MNNEQEVKKEVKSTNFYLSSIYKKIKAIGRLPTLNLTKQSLQYYINILKKQGIIAKKGYGIWEVKKEVKDFLIGVEVEKPLTNLHALQLTFPILKGNIRDEDWQVKNKLNNWIPKYKDIDAFGGLTFRNNNNKSLTIMVKSRNIKNLEEIDELSIKIRTYIFEYFRKEGIILDFLGCKVTNLNLATEDKHSQSMRRKGEKFELDLSKKAEKILPKDDINAKAWIDGSPFEFSAETNDKEWKRLYLTMPFNVHNIYYLFSEIAQNMSLFAKESAEFGVYLKQHTGAIKELKDMAKEIRKDVQQKKLGEWI